MKKILLSFAAFSLMFASCTKEAFDESAAGAQGEVDVTITSVVPTSLQSKAEAQLNSAASGIANVDYAAYDLRYILEVYSADGVTKIKRDMVTYDNEQDAFFQLRLVPNREYKFVVWADFVEEDKTDDRKYTTANGLNAISINGIQPFAEADDAYFIQQNEKINASGTLNLELKRPFAKFRVVTADKHELDGAAEAKSIAYKWEGQLASAFDAVTGEFTFANSSAEGKLDIPSYNAGMDVQEQFQTLFAEYLPTNAVSQEAAMPKLTLSIYSDEVAKQSETTLIRTHELNTDVPMRRNYLTTAIGQLLTVGTSISITIEELFENKNDDLFYHMVDSPEGLIKAIEQGGDIKLQADLNIAGNAAKVYSDAMTIEITKDTHLDLNGKTITYTDADRLFTVKGATLVLENGTINVEPAALNAEGNDIAGYVASATDDGKIIVNSGTYTTTDCTLFQATKGLVVVNGGEFIAKEQGVGYKYAYVLNCTDANYNNGTADILVRGGKFYKFNPADNAAESGGHTNFLATGLESVTAEGDYYVVGAPVINGSSVSLTEDISVTESIIVKGDAELDGNNQTINVNVNNLKAEGILYASGNATIKNVNIVGAAGLRNEDGKLTRGVYILGGNQWTVENVNVSGCGYALNVNMNKPDANLTVKDSSLAGWTSVGTIQSATFENVEFKKGDYFDATNPDSWNWNFRSYCNTTLIDCTFVEGFNLDFSDVKSTITVTFDGCTANGVALTAANIESLLKVTTPDNVTFAFN